MSKILLTCIVKDDSEAEIFERMLESFMPFMDGLLCGFTGVSGKFNKIKTICLKHGGKYIQMSPETHPEAYAQVDGKWIFASFAAARNVVYREADKLEGYDWYSWADTDDLLQGGENLHKIADDAIVKKVDLVFFPYWYAIKPNKDGTFNETNVEVDQLRERLIRARKFKWISRLHEINLPLEDNYQPTVSNWPYEKEKDSNVVWTHISFKERMEAASERNLAILKIQLEEEKWKDPRTIAYLAKSYYDLEKPEYDTEAIKLIEDKYLMMSGWEEDRSVMWNFLGHLYQRKGDMKTALQCFLSGRDEFPANIMNYLDMSQAYFELGRFDRAQFFVDQALKMDPPKSSTVMTNPVNLMYKAAGIKANLAIKKLDIDEVLKWLHVQDDIIREEDNQKMIKEFEDAKYYNQIGVAIFNFARYLKDKGYKDRARKLLEIIPPEYGKEPIMYKIANEVIEPRVWGPKSIVYFASFGVQHFEEWGPKNLDKGIGGSETAVIELAKRWAADGYEVTVFCDCGDDQGVYDGVIYRPYWEINWNDQFNTLILWRSPHLLDLDIHAKKLYMDLHDVASNLNYPPDKVKKLAGVFFKSKYQRRMLPSIPESKAIVISNGINL